MIECGCFQCRVIPFRLNNVPMIFPHMVITVFKVFIHKFLEVYFDDQIVFRLVKHHAASVCLMFDTCKRYQIVMNLKKCLLCVPIGIFQGHVV